MGTRLYGYRRAALLALQPWLLWGLVAAAQAQDTQFKATLILGGCSFW